MRVVVLPADMTGCGTYRCIWTSHVVRKLRPDWQIELYKPHDLQMSLHPDGSLQAIRGLPDPTGVDVLVTQRVGTAGQFQFLRWMQNHGVAVVVDADDALWCIDRDNQAYRTWNSAETHWRWMDAAAEAADLVTVTTGALAGRYGKHRRVEVIPNRILGAALQGAVNMRARYPATLTLGWSGFVGTHPRDLDVVGDAVARMVEKHGCAVRIIGDGIGVAKAWGLDPHQVEVTGSLKMDRYHSALTSIDVALVPLNRSPFNTAKSDLKAREFLSMGVPTVATPTPANRLLARSTPLLLADTPRQWVGHLEELVTQAQTRTVVGAIGRAALWDDRLDVHAEAWAQVWERAAVRRRKLVA